MDIRQIKTARGQSAHQIFEILKKLETDTGMLVGYVNTESETDFEGKTKGIDKVTIDLTLE